MASSAFFNVWSRPTMFHGFKHCLAGKNNVRWLQTMFGGKKQRSNPSNIEKKPERQG
jgi:hypothetical protein